MSVVGLLQDETDPMVSVMKVEKAPLESYADVGGLEQQITEIKEAVELPLTHPELYEDIGIKPPKVGGLEACAGGGGAEDLEMQQVPWCRCASCACVRLVRCKGASRGS
jgi:ATP-dependent 26S proteasome regulatory subunit